MSQDPETAAIITGFLVAMAIGAIIFIAQLVIWWLERRRRKADPYDQVGPVIHPADDLDDFDALDRWKRANPEQAENYLHDAMAHRERAKK